MLLAASSMHDVPSGWTLGIMIVLALVLGVYLWGSRRGKETRADALQKKYAELDSEKLAAIPDEELVDAVAANMMGQLNEHNPDWMQLLVLSSYGQRAVTSIWLVCREWSRKEESPYDVVIPEIMEFAADGLDVMGATACAAALRAGLSEDSEVSEEEIRAHFWEAAETEKPLEVCVPFIREHAADFMTNAHTTFLAPAETAQTEGSDTTESTPTVNSTAETEKTDDDSTLEL